MSTSNSIARNTTYYTIALIIQKILAFIYFSLIARFLGAENTGKYTYALSFTTLFAIFIDFGLAPVLIREIAKARHKAQAYISNVLALKIPLAIITYLLAVGMINILAAPGITRSLVYLSAIIMCLDSFSLSFWAVMRGHQQLKYESMGVVGMQLITVSCGSLTLFFNLGLIPLMLALVGGSLFNFLFGLFTLKKRLKLDLLPHYESDTLRTLFKIGIPFALAGIFNRIYTSLDTVLLSNLAGDAHVGWYSIPIKITMALQFLPMAFMAALFPAMSEYFISNHDKLKHTFEKAMRYLMIISLPVAVGIISLARPAILAVYTAEYLNSILPLRILMIGLFFLFINFPVGYLLNACNRQTTNTINMGITVVVSVILNIFLIPRYSYIGASIASVASTIILFLLGMRYVPKIIPYSKRYLLKSFIKILIACGFMLTAIYYLRPMASGIQFLWLVPIGAFIYFLALSILGGINRDDIIYIWNSIRSPRS